MSMVISPPAGTHKGPLRVPGPLVVSPPDCSFAPQPLPLSMKNLRRENHPRQISSRTTIRSLSIVHINKCLGGRVSAGHELGHGPLEVDGTTFVATGPHGQWLPVVRRITIVVDLRQREIIPCS